LFLLRFFTGKIPIEDCGYFANKQKKLLCLTEGLKVYLKYTMAASFSKKQKKVSEGPTIDFNGGSFVKNVFLGIFTYKKAGRSSAT
jgi:hypothetical protein